MYFSAKVFLLNNNSWDNTFSTFIYASQLVQVTKLVTISFDTL
jgi:hypothetical protein